MWLLKSQTSKYGLKMLWLVWIRTHKTSSRPILVVILCGLQASLTKLAMASHKQTAAFESLGDDIFLSTVGPTVEDSPSIGNKRDPSLDM